MYFRNEANVCLLEKQRKIKLLQVGEEKKLNKTALLNHPSFHTSMNVDRRSAFDSV